MDTKKLEEALEKRAGVLIPVHKIIVAIVYLGGPLTAIWLIWLTYTNPPITFWFSFFVLLSLVIGFKLGPAPFFAINCSWIHFQFNKIGLWLPILSYIIAIIMLILQLIAMKVYKD